MIVINRKNIFYFLLILFLIKPVGLDNISHKLNVIWNGLKIVSIAVTLLLVIRNIIFYKLKLNIIVYLTVLISALMFFSTFYNDQPLYNIVVYWTTVLSVLFIIELNKDSSQSIFNLIKTYTSAINILVVINFFTLIRYPDGILEDKIWFLGNDNMMILYLFPCMILNIIVDKYERLKIYYFRTLLIIFICAYIIYTRWSATTVAICTLFFLYYIFIYEKRLNHLINWFSAKFYLVCSACIFFMIVVIQLQEKFSVIIVNLLGKDLTFTGRVYAWDKAMVMIENSRFIGNGWETRIEGLKSILDYITGSISVSHAHDYYLDIAMRGGLAALAAFIVILLFVSKKLDSTAVTASDSNLINMIKFCFFLILVIFIFEAYPTNLMNFYFIIGLFYYMEKITAIRGNIINIQETSSERKKI